jgi:Zn-dependent M28 family amino/carboxypeptidase
MFFQRGGSSAVLERATLRLNSFKGSVLVLVLNFDYTACRNTNIYAITVNAYASIDHLYTRFLIQTSSSRL